MGFEDWNLRPDREIESKRLEAIRAYLSPESNKDKAPKEAPGRSKFLKQVGICFAGALFAFILFMQAHFYFQSTQRQPKGTQSTDLDGRLRVSLFRDQMVERSN